MNLDTKTVLVDRVPMDKEKPKGKSSPCLVQYSGVMLGKRYDLLKETMTIGRDLLCDIIIKDESTVSRKHAVIEKREEGFFLVDQKSTNGTFVNEKRIDEVQIKDGDMIKLGSMLMVKFFAEGNLERIFLDKIYKMAVVDAMTQIFNKKYFLEQLESEIKNAYLYTRPLCLIMFDIDHFKKTNDTYGHLAGDFILSELAIQVKKVIREKDIFARYGGEEFTLILPDTSIDDAYHLAERVRVAVEAYDFNFDDQSIATTISMGIQLLEPGMTGKELIEKCDKKLYTSKKEGRNRVTR